MEAEGRKISERDAPLIVGLGELIWDLLPGGRQLGGAPTNFAYISHLLGNRAVVASRVGADPLGQEALERLERHGISTRFVQLDDTHPTGTVSVRIDEGGEPRFAMNLDSAWDYLEWTDSWRELAARADAVCFGTLGQRQEQSHQTIISFLQSTRERAAIVFDVNLRHSFFTPAMLGRSLELAKIVKLNADELTTIAAMLRLEAAGEESLARQLIARFKLKLVAITRGEKGSLLVTSKDAVSHPGFRVRVRDTIGAGDAFTATLTHLYLRRAPLEAVSHAANRIGSWVASHDGATPEASPELLRELFNDTESAL